MKTKAKKAMAAITLTIVVFGLITLGNACSRFGLVSKNSNGGSSGSQCLEQGVEFEAIPGALTASVAYGKQTLDNMFSCTQLQQPSSDTLEAYMDSENSLATYDSLSDMSGPLLLSVAKLATHTCDDLWFEELSRPERNIYRFIPADNSDITEQDIRDTFKIMALSCWAQTGNERELVSEEEYDVMVDVANGLRAAGEDNRIVGVAICTTALSVLNGIKQ